MKKNILLCFLLIFISNQLMAQTVAERKKISDSYDMGKINELKKELQEKQIQREARINDYLKQSSKQERLKKEGKTYKIHDIIDGKPLYISTDNVLAAQATRTDALHVGGSLNLDLEGENMIVGVWDAESARASHVEFLDDQTIPQSRIVFSDLSGTVIDDHATRVAGTIMAKGTSANAKGMAPKAVVNSYDWDGAEQEMLTEGANGLLVSNHSYGFPIFLSNGDQQKNAEQIGNYSSLAREWDIVLFTAPYLLPVTSAGNEGTKNYTGGLAFGYDKLTDLSTVKNNMVVASSIVNFNASGGVQFFGKSDFSSQGPTDDFRIKPDITGKGENVFSSSSTNDTAYNTQNGTSFSAPNVSGSLILLQQYYNQLNSNYMRAATLRGLACHTAKDDAVKPGPDPFVGWGLLDAATAAQTITDASSNLAIIKELTLSDGETYTYQFSASGSGPIKASICWTDPAGVASNSPNNVLSPRLVNDLDLRLEDGNSTIFTPWKLNKANVAGNAIKGDNDVDNIERIDINSGIAGNYTLTVTHKGTLTNGSQAFSLIITGANLTLSTSSQSISSVVVWPNPVEDILNLDLTKLSGDVNIDIFDVNGRKVYQEQAVKSKKHFIKTNTFTSGVYFMNIKNNDLKIYKKIIIK